MDCKVFRENISLYIDDQLTSIEKKEFELHLLKCKDCFEEYESTINILKLIKDEPQEELPDNYRAKLREKLEESSKKNIKTFNWKKLSSLAAAILIVFVSYGLVSRNFEFNKKVGHELAQDSIENGNDFGIQSDNVNEEEGNSNLNIANNKSFGVTATVGEEDYGKEEVEENKDKIEDIATDDITVAMDAPMYTSRGSMAIRGPLKEAYIDIQVQDYDESLERISIFVDKHGGFVENWYKTEAYNHRESNQEEKTYTGYVRIRVPEKFFDETINYLKGFGIVKSENFLQQDLEQVYEEVQSNLKNLKIQEERLIDTLSKTENTDDMLSIENVLTNIRIEVEANMKFLEELGNGTNPSAVNVNLSQPEKNN